MSRPVPTLPPDTTGVRPPATTLAAALARSGLCAVVALAASLGACAAGGGREGEGTAPDAVGTLAGAEERADRASPGDAPSAGAGGDRRRAADVRPTGPSTSDADADGVADTADDCPATPSGVVVDASGCARFAGALDGVVFAPSDHGLGAASREALARLVEALETHPDVILRLEGHTDNRGTAASNLELSKRRVMAVARFLVANGIDPERLKPYGFGESRPRASNASEAGRERNRRIEIGQVRPPDALAEPDATGQNATDAD